MQQKTLKKILSVLLALFMSLQNMHFIPMHAEDEGSTWTKVALADITAEDEIAITMSKGDSTWVLPADTTSSAPLAKTGTISGTTLTTDAGNYSWKVTAEDGVYTFTNNEGKYLYATNANNGMRVGNTSDSWTLDSNYLKDVNNSRYLGVYNAQDWRCYTTINANITGQTLEFWKLESGAVPQPELETVTIAEALAGATNEKFKVKGVVTLVDGKNVYIQDETGGICLYFGDAPTDIALGDTLIADGARATYRGLPELSGGTYEKSGGLTLSAKETTIGALTTADVCTYVELKDLEVTEVYDNSGAYTSPNIKVKDADNNEIQIYKAVVGKTDGAWDVAVGDKVDVKAAVGINNTTLQLRNTLAEEIVLKSDAAVTVAAPTASVEAGPVEAGTVVTFSSATEGAVISYSIDNGEKWTEGNTYTVNEAVTILVKATLDGTDSAVASFAYTIAVPEPTYSTIAEALAGANGETFTVKGVITMIDARNVYIQDSTGGICLYLTAASSEIALGDTVIGTGARGSYRGMNQLSNATFEKSSGLTLSAKETTIGALTTADVCTYVELKGVEVTEVYDNNGTFANPNITVKDSEEKTIQIYKAVVGKTDGAWDVAVGDKIDVKAAVGINNTTLQLRNTSAEEITKQGDEPEPDKNGLITDLSVLEEGDLLVVYNEYGKYAMSNTSLGTYYRGLETVTIEEDKVVNPAETALWTLGIKEAEDGTKTYTFTTQDGHKLTAGTRNSLPLDDENEEWTITPAATEDSFYIISAGRPTQYVEYYESRSEFSAYTYAEANENVYAMKLYRYVKEDTPGPEPEETIWAKLTEAPADGSVVVLHYPASNMALTARASGAKLAGVAAEPAEDKLTITEDMAQLTVSVTDGVYTFVSGGKYLTSGATGNSLTFADAESDYSKWTLEQQTDGTWYIVSVNAEYNGTKQALEYYNGFTTYGVKTDNAQYKFDFYGDVPAASSLVTDLADLKDGSYVVIYNPGNKKALTNETYRDWYMKAADAVIEDDNVVDPAANTVWKVSISEDGAYTFTSGDSTLSAWLDGNYVELTGNPNYNSDTDSAWKLEVCNAETSTFYMYSNSLTTTYGNAYMEVYGKKVDNVSGVLVFCGYSTSADKLTEQAYGMQFYLVPEPEEPQETGDLVTSLSQLTDGAKVMIYSPSHKTAISSKPNGDWYLKAENATVEDGKPVNFTKELIWTVTQENGEYVFTADADTSRVISVWPSGTYAELTVNPEYNEETVHGWNLQPFNAADHTWYIKSSTLTLTKNNTELAVYIEAYIRNDFEVFSGYAPYSNQLSNTDYALQFYLVNPEDAVEGFDDGEWDGILNKGESYVAYNFAAESSIGLFKEANYAMDAIPTTIEGDVAVPGNGAYVFTVDTMGRYYSFELNGKYLATNNEEELLFVEKDENGVLPDTAKWFLQPKEGGYIIYNKEASYGGTPVCIEYYSSVFSGWTYSPKNDVNIYLFKFYKAADDTKIVDGVVQDPKVIYDGDTIHHPEEDYKGAFSLDDLAESIVEISIYLNIKGKQIPITDYESDESGKTYKFTVPAETIDAEGLADKETFELHVEVKNSYAIEYEGVLEIPVVDEPFFYDEKPEAGSQTGEDKKPVVSVKVGNVGENPEFTMVLSGETVETVYEDKTVSYTPAEDMEDGFYTVTVTVKREDGKEVNFSWGFYVGDAKYQRYFGQLHSHTTYSDGSGSLETALDYIANLPESANVQFVAFTDHSNYFDTTSASNPADAMNDKSLMTDASRALWEQYKNTVAEFNAEHKGLVAIAGYEMTWSGGPGHINSFSTDGLVSRNNAALNNKSGDAGMKLYYDTMIKDHDTIQQFNHPGNTFGNFTDFAYWTEEYDRNMFLVEVGNGEGQIGAGGYYPSYEQYDLALSKGWHVAPTNNQDNHKGRWGNANDARDVVLADKLTEEDIYNAIRALRVYSTEDKNLEIDYTVNDMPMGTIFSEDEPVETMNVVITLFDPDKSDGFSKVELIVDGGRTAYTWNDASELAAGELTAQLDPEYSYYYVKVTQKDGDLAVTAPIWVTKAAKVGVTEIKSADEKVYTGKEATLVTTLFNNEEKAATVKSLTYTVNGSEVIGTDTTERTLAANGTLDVEFKHTFDAAKVTKVTVTAVIEYDGKEGSYIANVELDVIDEETENVVTPIADVRAASDPEDTGYRFVIEGVVTSNASGYDKDTAFFDCVYVQDETGGICVFPVSGEYKIGDKVHIVGHTDFYQGEPELQVQTIEIIGEGEVTPEEVTAKQIADREAEGKLVTLKGTIVSVEEANGLILAIIVKDANGDEARVFIDGYITTENEIKNAVVGNKITATGLASYDDTWADTDYLPRIRVRDRADVVCEDPLEAPVIIEHPESLTVRSGNEASFKVVAEGEDLQYQWYYRTSETGTWAKSTATCANTDTYTLPASSVISWRSGYQYRCEVKNSAGSVMSNEATLTVTKTPKPVIIEQPEDVTVRSGNEAVFKVVAEGEDLQYQWYYRTSETGTWAKSTATCANTDTYTVPASSVISWRDGYQYRCVVSTKGGYVISDTATLTVTKTPAPVITGQPQSVSAKPGTEVSFTVEAEGEDLKYQWYYRTSSTGTWTKSTSSCATEATYTLPGTSVVKKRNGYEYRCVVYNKGGNVISEAAVLKIVATANEVRPDNLFSVTAYGY